MSWKITSLLLIPALLCAVESPSAAPAVTPSGEAVEWNFGSFDSVLRQAARREREVLIYFWMPSSGQCTQMYEETWQSGDISGPTAPFVCYSANHGEDQGAELFERFKVTTVPAVRIVNADGDLVDGLNGYADVSLLTSELARIETGEGTLPALRRESEAAPEDLELRNALAGKLLDLGDQAAHDELQNSIMADDPEGRSEIAARLILSAALTDAVAQATSPAEVDFESLYTHAEAIRQPDVAFTFWNRLARMETCLNGLKPELAAIEKAWSLAPEANKLNWGQTMADWLWSCRDEVSKDQKLLALEMATLAAERADMLSVAGSDGFGNLYNGDDPDAFLAGFIDTQARCSYMNGMVVEARELVDLCLELDPQNPEYTARAELYRGRKPDRPMHVYLDSRPVWSPNGKQVLFTSNRDGNQELYLADVRKGAAKRLTRTRSDETSGTFDPKGRTILFNSNRFQGVWTIYSMSSSGKRQELLVPLDPDTPVSISDPSYAPDGKSIAYTTERNGKGEIAVAKPDGSDERILTASTEHTDMQPFWSPDGDEIYYMSTRLGDADVWAISAKGDEDRNITNAPENSWDMDGNLSPDGEQVVFSSWRSGQLEIYICDREGGNVRSLTQSPSEDRHPRWSPKGDRIVFERKLEDGTQRLFVMDADGSDTRALLSES